MFFVSYPLLSQVARWRTCGGRSHDRLQLEFRATRWSLVVPTVASMREVGLALWEILQELDTNFLEEHALLRRGGQQELVKRSLLPLQVAHTEELEALQKLLHFPEEVALRLADAEYHLFYQVPPIDYLRQVTLDLGGGGDVIGSGLAEPHHTHSADGASASSTVKPSVRSLIKRFKEWSITPTTKRWSIHIETSLTAGELVGDPSYHHPAHTRGQEGGAIMHPEGRPLLLEHRQLQRSHGNRCRPQEALKKITVVPGSGAGVSFGLQPTWNVVGRRKLLASEPQTSQVFLEWFPRCTGGILGSMDLWLRYLTTAGLSAENLFQIKDALLTVYGEEEVCYHSEMWLQRVATGVTEPPSTINLSGGGALRHRYLVALCKRSYLTSVVEIERLVMNADVGSRLDNAPDRSNKLKPFWLSITEKESLPVLDFLSAALLSAEYERALCRALAMTECRVVPFFGAFLHELREILATTPSLVVLAPPGEQARLEVRRPLSSRRRASRRRATSHRPVISVIVELISDGPQIMDFSSYV
uniref:Uncharacterized protein n=1 Tax=Timema cristinae TaxID=61476 RepID=A0A7R9CBI5_TIMCR|nr:unnamed protein product [Timema cristinae]